MTWQVVTNGSKYRLRDIDNGVFYTEYTPMGYSGYNRVIEFDSKEEALAKAKPMNWYPIEEKY